MKNYLNLIIVLLSLCNGACHPSRLVQTIEDASKLELNEKKFIGKPLNKLLAAIKPKIEVAVGRPGNKGEANIISFYPISKNEYSRYRMQDKFPPAIRVYLKENFEWDRTHMGVNWMNWTERDRKKYGVLTVVAIRVDNVKR
jgi:hypothetical protein